MTEFESWKAAEAAAYLKGVRQSSLDVRRLQDEIDVQRSLLPSGMDVSRAKVRTSPQPDALELAAIRVIEMVEQYVTELAGYVEMQRDAHDAVRRMGDARHRAVLTLYYIDGHSWETVGEKLGYSVDWCKELRAQALPLFWDVMPRHGKTMVPRAD